MLDVLLLTKLDEVATEVHVARLGQAEPGGDPADAPHGFGDRLAAVVECTRSLEDPRVVPGCELDHSSSITSHLARKCHQGVTRLHLWLRATSSVLRPFQRRHRQAE